MPVNGISMIIVAASQVHREAIQSTEQDGIVFLDEIDKIVTSADKSYGSHPLKYFDKNSRAMLCDSQLFHGFCALSSASAPCCPLRVLVTKCGKMIKHQK